MMNAHALGVLGGTGPAACAHAHTRLVESAQRDYACINDQDFPAIFIANAPLPETTARGWSGCAHARVRAAALDSLRTLLNAGAELILPVCNTIDIFAPDIADLTPTPVLSLPVLAGFEGTRRGYERLGVLSSRTARKMNLHARVLSALDMETVITTEAEQTRVDTLIAHLMGASTDERTQAQAELFALGTGLLARGAESVIVGCTELSMIARAQWEWIDTTALAVDAALAFAYNKQVLSVCA